MLGSLEILANQLRKSGGSVHLGKLRSQFQRAIAGFARFFSQLRRRIGVHGLQGEAVGIPCPGQSKSRITVDRLPEHLTSKLEVRLPEAIQELPAAEVILIRHDVLCGRSLDRLQRIEQ